MKRIEILIDSESMDLIRNVIMMPSMFDYSKIEGELSSSQVLIAQRIKETDYEPGVDDPKLSFTQEDIDSILQSAALEDIQTAIDSEVEGIVTRYDIACGNVQLIDV